MAIHYFNCLGQTDFINEAQYMTKLLLLKKQDPQKSLFKVYM